MWRFLGDIAAAQDRRRVEAARHPLAVIPPARGADLGPTSPVYVRTSFPRQLPGNRPDVGHPRWPAGEHGAQEADFQLACRSTTSRIAEADFSYGLGESDSVAREARHDAWIAALDPEVSVEPFVDVLDPSWRDGDGDRFLGERGFTRTGREKSCSTRGGERLPVEEAVRRALVHCADLDRHYRDHRHDNVRVTLEALRAPYRPRPGQGDPLMDARRAVAVCLRLEGFKARVIALVLDRDESRIEDLIGHAATNAEAEGVEPFYRPVPGNWTAAGEDNRASGMRWRRELHGIAADISELPPTAPIRIPADPAVRRELAREAKAVQMRLRSPRRAQNPWKS